MYDEKTCPLIHFICGLMLLYLVCMFIPVLPLPLIFNLYLQILCSWGCNWVRVSPLFRYLFIQSHSVVNLLYSHFTPYIFYSIFFFLQVSSIGTWNQRIYYFKQMDMLYWVTLIYHSELNVNPKYVICPSSI